MPKPSGALTSLLGRALASDRRCGWILALTSLVCVRFYFARGDLSWSGDGSLHLTYAALAAAAIGRGELPIWTNYFAAGSPFLQFYGFLFFYAVGVLDLLVGDLQTTVKVVLAAGHVLSGLAACAFLRAALRSRPAAFVGGLAYVLTFWHTQHVLIMGRLPLSLFYALLPLPFYGFELARVPGRRPTGVVLGAAALAGLVFAHPGYAAWATGFLAAYAVLRTAGPGGSRRHWRHASAGGALIGLGLALAAPLWLPMWLERGATGLASGIDLAGVPDPSWRQLLGWSNYRLLVLPLPEANRHWYGGYLGLSLVVLAALGLAGPVVRRRRLVRSSALAAGCCLLAALVLVLGYRFSLLQQMAAVQAFNAGRFLLFVSFFLAVAAGAGAHALLGWRRGAGPGLQRVTLALAVILVDLGPTTFQQPYTEPRGLAAPGGLLPPGRFLAVTGAEHPPLALTLLHWETGRATPQGIYDESSASYRRFTAPLARQLEPLLAAADSWEELERGPQGATVLAGLRLLDVDRVYLFRDQRGQARDLPPGATGPVVVSARLEAAPADSSAAGLVRAMALEPGANRCARILRPAGSPSQELGTAPDATVLAQRVEAQRVTLDLEVTARCWARLAWSWNPHLAVLVDDRRVEAFETAEGFLGLPLDAGRHRVVLEPRLSPLRQALWGLDLALLAGAAVVLRRRRQR